MFKSALFGRKKTTTRPFADFYNDWSTTLATTLLPQLRRALSSFPVSPAVLSTQVDAVYNHFHAYYTALDQAAAADVAQCLYPEWRNSLEKPFLWLGDLHPYLFTNLLRSFLEDQESSQDENDDFGYDVTSVKESLYTSWHVAAAWRSPSKALTARIDQIACGLRLMVPALAARARHAQAKLVRNVGAEWGRKEGVLKAAVAEAVAAEMEELVGVVVDANRLRRSVLADVLSVTSVYQAASFLEAVAQFLVGFRDEKLLREFDKCEKAIT
ncbi:protein INAPERTURATE POLLEN1 [Sesamum indicum]|uniref:Protein INAPERTURATE POLLEN1 n=1 Tax=Sesamum indicum TaxID=4182 RepID=A0A6I9TEX6_SESIN|nr:protein INAPERTURATE POLLEN1 [Sesamum indicum]